MNRRGFLGSLAAAVVAPFLPKPKTPDRSWIYGDGLRHRPTATGTIGFPDNGVEVRDALFHPNQLEAMKKIMEQAGKSHARVKAEAAARVFDGAFK